MSARNTSLCGEIVCLRFCTFRQPRIRGSLSRLELFFFKLATDRGVASALFNQVTELKPGEAVPKSKLVGFCGVPDGKSTDCFAGLGGNRAEMEAMGLGTSAVMNEMLLKMRGVAGSPTTNLAGVWTAETLGFAGDGSLGSSTLRYVGHGVAASFVGDKFQGVAPGRIPESRCMPANAVPKGAALGNVDGVARLLRKFRISANGVAGGGDAGLVGEGSIFGVVAGNSLIVGSLMRGPSVLIGGLLCRGLRFVGDLASDMQRGGSMTAAGVTGSRPGVKRAMGDSVGLVICGRGRTLNRRRGTRKWDLICASCIASV